MTLPRRSFLSRLGLVAGTALAARFSGMAKSITDVVGLHEQDSNPVLRIKPLGFQLQFNKFSVCGVALQDRIWDVNGS